MADEDSITTLIKGCIQGKRKAQYELYRHCYVQLMPVCQRYEQNEEDARAILNEGFLKILDNLSTFRREVPFEAWAKRVMINTIIDEYRKNRNKPTVVDYQEFDQNGELGVSLNEALEVLRADDLEQMLHELPPTSRKVFNLYVIDGYSHQEIGNKLSMSEGTSKWHLNQARTQLQQILKDIMNPSQKMAL